MKHVKHHQGGYSGAGYPVQGQLGRGRISGASRATALARGGPEAEAGLDDGLLDELEALLNRLGAVKISMTLYLVEFAGLPGHLALPLLQQAAGPCAMLRLPAQGQHLVIFLGPEPSAGSGGFLARLERGLVALAPPEITECAWAEARMLRRCNHDVAAPACLLLDLHAAAARVLGITD